MWVAAHSEEEALMKAENQLQTPASQLSVRQGTSLHDIMYGISLFADRCVRQMKQLFNGMHHAQTVT